MMKKLKSIWKKLFSTNKEGTRKKDPVPVPERPIKYVYPSRDFSPAPVQEEKEERVEKKSPVEHVQKSLRASYIEWVENNRQLEKYFSV